MRNPPSISLHSRIALLIILGIRTLLSASSSDGATLYGYLRNGATGIGAAEVLLFDTQTNFLGRAPTDGAGMYILANMPPGEYLVRTEARGYANQWHDKANHIDDAAPLTLGDASPTRCDFDLARGQSPALVRIVSIPSNAWIYVDYRRLDTTTPAIVSLGEAAPWALQSSTNSFWLDRASHVIGVYLPGHPVPPPQKVPGMEAATCSDFFSLELCDDYFIAGRYDTPDVPGICSDYFIAGICGDAFDLRGTNTGSLFIQSNPTGAVVYVNQTDEAQGLAPIAVTNLLQGWHVVFVRLDGYQVPRPIRVFVAQNETYELNVDLAPIGTPGALSASVQSVPAAATNFLDGFSTTNVTDNTLGELDASNRVGNLHYSVSHLLSLRKPGRMNPLFQYVDASALTNGVTLSFTLLPNPNTLGDAVWYDWNTNGIQDAGEPLATGVVVNLRDASSNLLQQVATDSSGHYQFHDLAPGDYFIEFIPPTGYVFSPYRQGVNAFLDSDVAPGGCRTPIIPLADRRCDPSWDAGLIPFTPSAFWFRAIALTNQVVLSWQSPDRAGMMSQTVHVRYDLNDYPSNTADGASLYTGADRRFFHEGLISRQTYYYTIFVSHNGIEFLPPP